MMTKKISIGLVIVALIVAAIFILRMESNTPCDPPSVPQSISAAYRWVGGCDGGVWVSIVQSENGTHLLSVYSEDGLTEMERSKFALQNCDQPVRFNLEMLNYFSYNDSDEPYFGIQDSKCRLEVVR